MNSALLIRDLTGRVTAWIEVGMPDPERLHRGFKLAGRAAVYTHCDVQKVVAQLSAAKIDRVSAVPVYEFDRSFVDELAGLIERRSTVSISVTANIRRNSRPHVYRDDRGTSR